MPQIFKKVFLFLFIILQFYFYPAIGETQNNPSSGSDVLRQMIDEKNSELRELQIQREVLEKDLEKINKSGSSLKNELQTINSTINQLNLAVKANKLSVEKLELELDSLKDDIQGIEKNIDNKKETIVKLLVELQKKDRENILITILKNQNLSRALAEEQSISTINNALSVSAGELKEFHGQLLQKLDSEEEKKRAREIERVSLKNRQYIVEDQKTEKQTLLAQTKNQEKIYKSQIAEISKKQEAIGDELEKIEDELRASFDPNLLPAKRPGVFKAPVQNPLITQEYGKTKFAERAYKTKFHNGIDFNASIGTPIFAAKDGKITATGNNGRYQYGKFVLIEHDNNLSSLYAHLSRFAVQGGQVVKEGDIIGYSGNTGYTTGPHLHFTLYWAASVILKSFPGAGIVPIGITLDPKDYL